MNRATGRSRFLSFRGDTAGVRDLIRGAYPDQTGQTLEQTGFLARNGGDGALRRDLFTAEATAATLMGQLVWDASQRRDHREPSRVSCALGVL